MRPMNFCTNFKRVELALCDNFGSSTNQINHSSILNTLNKHDYYVYRLNAHILLFYSGGLSGLLHITFIMHYLHYIYLCLEFQFTSMFYGRGILKSHHSGTPAAGQEKTRSFANRSISMHCLLGLTLRCLPL